MAKRATAERMVEIFEQVKNWGRWGTEDESGALNLVTAAKRAAAARLVESGEMISCAREFPVTPSPENPNPALHFMARAGDACAIEGTGGLQASMDFVGVAFHGMAVSHLDALCHVFVEEQMYNGFPATDVKSTGARRNSVMVARDGVSSRGVLLDIPRLRGVPYLEGDAVIEPDELTAAEEQAGLRVEPGDVLLVATGRDARRAELGPWNPVEGGLAGLHPECAVWLRERDVAVLGSDGVSDPLPNNDAPDWPIPIHQCTLVAMGVHLLDNLELGRLAEACARHSRWEFLFVFAPLRVEGGTGSPVNPVALF